MRLEQPELGRVLREQRQAAGMTQRALAEAAGVGSGADYISKVERGERGLDLETVERVAAALGVDRSLFLAAGGSARRGQPLAARETLAAVDRLVHALNLAVLEGEITRTAAAATVGVLRERFPEVDSVVWDSLMARHSEGAHAGTG